jgi:threonine dehydratase
MITLTDIEAARERIKDAIYRSPCPYSLSLSRLCNAQIFCKLDHLQMTGSFKERGARNKLVQLSPEQRKAGVIAASAGNHALALAYHGGLLKIPVTVVMPKFAPLVKVTNCKSFHANVISHGESFDEARKFAMGMGEEKGMTYVPGFDDDAIIAGTGTIGLEILEDVPDVDAVVTPVGGGGLIAGIGAAVKAKKPNVKIIGVEPYNAPTLERSLKAGKVVHVATSPTLADGLAVAETGKRCFEIAQRVVDQMILVDESEIARAVLKLLEHEKMVLEGAGAVPLAALMGRTSELDGKKVVLVLCGGNIDVTVLGRIIERGLAADGRLVRFVVDISDRPGSLAKLLAILGEVGASVKEVEHDRHFGPADVSMVRVNLILETKDRQHIEEVHLALQKAGIIFQK